MSAVAPGGLSASLMLGIDRLSRELRADSRAEAERASQEALRRGLAEAAELRDKADEVAEASLVKAASLGVSGAVQLGAAAQLKISPGGEAAESIKTANDRLSAFAQAGTTAGQAGAAVGDALAASAEGHEASAREHAARGAAAGRKAEAASSASQEARQSGERARDLYQQLSALEHASRMAVLKG